MTSPQPRKQSIGVERKLQGKDNANKTVEVYHYINKNENIKSIVLWNQVTNSRAVSKVYIVCAYVYGLHTVVEHVYGLYD
jgi:hypothetical protein